MPLTQYSVPRGQVGKRFLAILAQEFEGVHKCSWNSEHPIIFAATILQTTVGVSRARDIQRHLMHQMDLWEKGFFFSLVGDMEAEVLGCQAPGPDQSEQARHWAFNAWVLSGCI